MRRWIIPNWCGNVLTVRGEPKELQRFYEENAVRREASEFERPSRSKKDEHRKVVALPLSFERALPTPPEFKDKPSPPPGHKMVPNELTHLLDGTVEPYDWYTWRLVHWGTKWDLSRDISVLMDYRWRKIVYKFDTAWSPPIAWATTVSKKYPQLVFFLEYEEGGNNFEGRAAIQNGIVLDEQEGEYTRCFKCNERGCNCTPAQKRGDEE